MPDQFLHGVEIIEINDGARPIQTVKSSVIGLVGTAPQGPVNTPTLILGSRKQATEIFGENNDANKDYTIPKALDGIFDQAGAMVVVINVADPDNLAHLTTGVLDPTNIIDADVVGGVDVTTGQYKGVHALLADQYRACSNSKNLNCPKFHA